MHQVKKHIFGREVKRKRPLQEYETYATVCDPVVNVDYLKKSVNTVSLQLNKGEKQFINRRKLMTFACFELSLHICVICTPILHIGESTGESQGNMQSKNSHLFIKYS